MAQYVELHNQVETSVRLLNSLETFLSTFQKDLSAVSGQISDLQDRSKDIESRLKSRRRIEKPLSNLITDITVPPHLATRILDSDVDESWILSIEEFERRLVISKGRSRVKAARDLGEVMEGLRIVAATKIRAFFIALFQPIRTNVTTNMQVMQTSVLLKYRPLFSFLHRQAPNVAHELQRSYIAAARVYYETGFRRYARSLTWIKSRTVEKFEPIVSSERERDVVVDSNRLEHAKIEGPSVTLAYMADDKTHKSPIEALARSLLLVFMDNATAEYAFVGAFFASETLRDAAQDLDVDLDNALLSPSLLSPDPRVERRMSIAGSDRGARHRQRAASVISAGASGTQLQALATAVKEDQASTDAIWKQIMDPVLEYTQTFFNSVLDPPPPVVPLLTIIRLTESVMTEVQKRACPPVESFVFTLRLKMWPVFQKAMTENIETLKKSRRRRVYRVFYKWDDRRMVGRNSLANIYKRYIAMFNSFVILTAQAEETMIFANLLRMQQELAKLITRHTDQAGDPIAKATAQSTIYESLLHGLSQDTPSSAHPKAQQEIAYWSKLQEDARRKIVARNQLKSRR
ncbi:Vacuolar sorting protein [Mycena indigotica]|uniref:Vacuolar sorting protein n=1 Tax=Mycena indigotica TaxID=2126181 RepID=A0A8H6SPW7_9AGAR|nr:Vacuolar sorting protein [Mycena indigotica]KAF7301810.1 Vacuolar sorting protein [Mycena indigotica]